MKRIIIILAFFILTLPVYSQGLPVPRVPTVGVLPFTAEGVSDAEAAEATRLIIAEISSWGVMTVLSGNDANNGEYIIQGNISREDDQIVIRASTTLRSTGRVITESRERAATLAGIPIFTFCVEVTENIPFPNFLIGRWQSTVEMAGGPVSTILEFRADRTVNVLRYDTWERDGTDSLLYQAIGAGTYSYFLNLRRTAIIDGRQIQTDATAGVRLILEDALPYYSYLSEDGLRLLFNEARTSFEIVAGGLPFGDDRGPGDDSSRRVYYTTFTQVPITPAIAHFPAEDDAIHWLGASPFWSLGLSEIVDGQPHLQAESAVLAFTDGSVQSFHSSGRTVWRFDSGERAIPVIARSVEGVTYVSNASGMFRAINRVGRELWRVNFGRPVSYQPVIGWDGRLFIPMGSMLSSRTASGNPLWTIDLESPMLMPPTLDRAGSLITVLENLDFIRVNPFSVVERISLQERPSHIVPLKEGDRYSYILLYSNGRTEKISFNELSARGSRLTSASFVTLAAPPASAISPVLSTGRSDQFAVTLRDGRVLLMNGQGQILWTGDSHETTLERGTGAVEPSMADMVFDERGIYSISTRGVTGFDLDGRRRFIHRFNEAASIPSFCDEGLVYVSTRGGQMLVYRIEGRARNVAHTKYYGPEPEGTYGLGNPPPSPWADDPRRFTEFEQDEMYAMILRIVNSGQIGEHEPRFVAYLMEMIGFFLNDPHYSRLRPAINPPRHVELIHLLGRMGSRETIPYLLTIFDRYHEPAVRSACAEAIGFIGVDPHGSSFDSFRFLLAPNNPNRDPQLLLSATSSVAALSRFSGPPLSGEGIVLLRYFTFLSWAPNSIRNHIREVVDELYNEEFHRLNL